MDPAELSAACETLGFTTSDLASDLGIPIHQAEAWLAGTLDIPRRIAMDLRYRAAVQQQDRALEAAGIPRCEWIAEWPARVAAKPRKLDAHLAALTAHVESCGTCQAVDAFAATLPPLPPSPPPAGVEGVVTRFMAWTDTLPVWARPAVQAGAAFGAMTVMRNVFAIPQMMRDPRVVGLVLMATAAATLGAGYLGLICGFVYRWMVRTSAGSRLLGTGSIGLAGAAALTVAGGAPFALYYHTLPEAGFAWGAIGFFVCVTGLLFASWLRLEQKGVKRPYL